MSSAKRRPFCLGISVLKSVSLHMASFPNVVCLDVVSMLMGSVYTVPSNFEYKSHQIQKYVSRLVSQLSLYNPLKPGVVGATPIGDLQLHQNDEQVYCLPRCKLY